MIDHNSNGTQRRQKGSLERGYDSEMMYNYLLSVQDQGNTCVLWDLAHNTS